MDEKKLIISAQNGEKEAFQSLISLYYPYVSKFLLKQCSDERLCEDLTQDTFVKLIRGIENFDVHGRATFATYVITIAKNCYIDYLRKNKQIFLNIEDQNIVYENNLQDTVNDSMQMEQVLKAIDDLPYEQAQAIKLKYFEQMTLKEIAQKFNCEPNKIKSRIHNGIVKLRKNLEGELKDG